MIKKNHHRKRIPFFLVENVETTMNEIKKKKYDMFKEVAVISKSQVKGRGRRGTSWISKKGNLYLSIKLKNRIRKDHQFITYMVSITVFDTIKKYLKSGAKLLIKWPNDIYINNKKVSGIIIEFVSTGNIISDIIIGVGININHCPINLAKPATHLSKFVNSEIKILELAFSILVGINYWSKVLSNNKKLIIKEWMKRANKLNSNIKFNLKNKLVNGYYKGINNNGSIRVLVNNKLINFFNLELI